MFVCISMHVTYIFSSQFFLFFKIFFVKFWHCLPYGINVKWRIWIEIISLLSKCLLVLLVSGLIFAVCVMTGPIANLLFIVTIFRCLFFYTVSLRYPVILLSFLPFVLYFVISRTIPRFLNFIIICSINCFSSLGYTLRIISPLSDISIYVMLFSTSHGIHYFYWLVSHLISFFSFYLFYYLFQTLDWCLISVLFQ